MSLLIQREGEVFDYTVNWKSALGSATISSSTWQVPSALTKVSDSNTSTTTTVRISGGDHGVVYTLINKVTYSTGEEDVERLELLVLSDRAINRRLEAVNEMLEVIGERPANGLDTGGTTIVAQAETILDREIHEILERGWWANTDPEVEYEPPDRKISASGGSGDFKFAETITGGSSGATGTFQYDEGGEIFYFADSGDLQNGETLTGSESGATRTAGSAPSTLTEAKIRFGPDVLDAEPAFRGFGDEIAMRGDFFYKRDDATFTFGETIEMAVTYLIEFHDLPRYLQRLVVRQAALAFSRAVKGSVQEDAIARQELDRAWARALQENGDKERPNVLDTAHARAIRGRRRGRFWFSRWGAVDG